MTGRGIKAATAAAVLIGSSSLVLDVGASHALASSPAISRVAAPTSTAYGYGYEAYAGSPKYLAYGRFAVEVGGRLASSGELFVKTLHGKPRKIATVSRSLDDVGLAGPMLVRNTSSLTGSPITVTWLNLASGAHGTFQSNDPVIAAPTGWITTQAAAAAPHAETVYLHTPSGRTTTLGTPHPDGTSFGLTVSKTTAVADSPYDDLGDGTAQYVALNHSGKFHPLVPASDGDVTARCDSVTSRFIACNTSGAKGKNALYSATGKLIVSSTRHCLTGPAVDGASMAWVTQGGSSCPSHQLVIVSPQGKAQIVPGTFGIGTPTATFGKIVVGKHLAGGNRWFKELVVVTSSGSERTLLG